MKIAKVEADYGDAITIQKSTNVWVDHCDLSASREGDKDFYDGLVDLSHAADWVTISNTYFHDHVSVPEEPNAHINRRLRKLTCTFHFSPRDHWSGIRTTTQLKTLVHSM